uniref:Alpha/beta hydrolase fold-3 domain-containing protein n=1 Tax=Leersia perrieri TaxID=77586 RepID=A0A0D9VRK3_9ORYZ
MDPDTEIAFDFQPYLRQYKSGRVVRYGGEPVVPTGTDPVTGVVSRDVHAGDGARARVYLPPGAAADANAKLPVVVYFHGGAFVTGSPARPLTHAYLNDLVSRSGAIGVSVYYRLAPESPLPAAYDDAWAAVRWAATRGAGGDTWLLNHANMSRGVFLAGCSAGANIAHEMAVRCAGAGVALRGLVLVHPYFAGEEAIGGETEDLVERRRRTWRFTCPDTPGLDDRRLNPFVDGEARAAAAAIPCERVLVCVAEKDYKLKDRGLWYYRELKGSGYGGEVELFESMSVGHAFHFGMLDSRQAVQLQERTVAFIKK